MNPKQAIALGIGIIIGVILVMTPRISTTPVQISHQVQPNGSIIDVRQSHQIFWQPPVYILVILVTGYAVLRLRTIKETP
jgi:hypothetical protein